MYVTLEPCSMCKGAIKQSRIKKVYYAAEDKKVACNEENIYEFMEDEKCSKILKDFFQGIRNK